MVQGGQCSSNEWSDPEYPLVIPSVIFVVDNGSAKATCRIDASSCDGDGGQVNQENRKPNWERSQYLDMGVSGISLGISCREYDIDKDEGSNDLSTKAITLGVAMSHHVGPSPITHIQRWLEPLHNPCTTDGS
nr:putative aquaporin [Ipomoea batatas]